MAMTSSEQVARLLALVPYLQAHPDADVNQTAAVFGVTPRQLLADLNVAWFCGLPGGLPGDLIEVDMDVLETQGRIRLSNADFLAKPQRFTHDEATSLVVALRLLAEVADPDTATALSSALTKLEGVVGQTPEVGVRLATGADATRAALQQALEDGVAITLTYHGASRREVTTPTVDPARLAIRDGVAYLDGWSHDRQAWRTYRLDRIADVTITDQPTADHGPVPSYGGGWLDHHPDAVPVTLELAPEGAWITEYYPMVSVSRHEAGGATATLLVADPIWFQRLLLRLGSHVVSVDPPEAAASAGRAARAALAQQDQWSVE